MRAAPVMPGLIAGREPNNSVRTSTTPSVASASPMSVMEQLRAADEGGGAGWHAEAGERGPGEPVA